MSRLQYWIVLSLLLMWLSGCQAPLLSSDPVTWIWSYRAGDYIRSKPTVAGEIVYIGADDNRMHAVDVNTGEALWDYETADNITSAVAIGNDQVYFGSWDGVIYAIDSAGELRWRVQTDGWVSATPVLYQESLYVGSQDGIFYTLAADSGEFTWRYETNGRIETSAIVAEDLIVFTTTDGYVHALDMEDGQRQWFFFLGAAPTAPLVVAGDQVYVTALNRTLHALGVMHGELRWTFNAEAPIRATAAVVDDVVYIGDDDGKVTALDVENGHPIWHRAMDEIIRSTLTVWHELLFVGTNSGNLYALDIGSGMPLWQYRLGGAITEGPTIGGERLYVGSTARQLQAFQLEAGQLPRLLSSVSPTPEDEQILEPQKAAKLYAERTQDFPLLIEYTRLWSAAAEMPSIDAVRKLHTVIDYRPQSPAAYQAHLILARYYAEQEAPAAVDNYRTALTLNDNAALRQEFAHYLENVGDEPAAYAEYQAVLSRQPDAFVGMRRTGSDPLQVAADLNRALYYTDALETLRTVAEAAALPLRAQAYLGLGRYAEAAAAYRAQIRLDPGDEAARMGLALALAWLGDAEAALNLYSTVDTPESRRRQAQLLASDEPEQALQFYLASPEPTAWWAASALLESGGRFTETLSIYERLAESDSQNADDAAYRLTVLGQRLGDAEALAKGDSLLRSFGLNWLGVRSTGEALLLEVSPPIAVDIELMDKVEALEAIGRDDFAHMELVFAARFRSRPEFDLAMALALVSRGDVREAQRIAERLLNNQPFAALAVWELSYPRPYAEIVNAAAAEFGVDPRLIWAVIREESRFDQDALSHAGTRGLMQVIPATQTWIAGELDEKQAPGDAYDPVTSVRMGAWLLRFLTDYFEGDLELAIPAYNAGAGSVESWQSDPRVEDRDDLLRWIGYGETRLYLKRVALSYQIYRVLYAESTTN